MVPAADVPEQQQDTSGVSARVGAGFGAAGAGEANAASQSASGMTMEGVTMNWPAEA